MIVFEQIPTLNGPGRCVIDYVLDPFYDFEVYTEIMLWRDAVTLAIL